MKETIEAFLEGWDRQEWMQVHGEWASSQREGDYIAEGVIDPDEVADGAKALGVGDNWQGWECNEGWAAYRVGEALYVRWYRNAHGNRHDRDLWVCVDDAFFQE